jgi:hypothetical protein
MTAGNADCIDTIKFYAVFMIRMTVQFLRL